jgi:hypothetical protein
MLDETFLTHGSASPFLPGTSCQFAWDATSLELLKRCPRLYQLTMIEGWTPKDESIHLAFGTAFHTALQNYAILRSMEISHEDSVHDVIAEVLRSTADWNVDLSTKAGRYKNRDTIVSLVLDYLDYFTDDPTETYIMSDGKPAVELSFRFELDWGPGEAPYLLCGHLDRVVTFNDQLFVMDHKTTTTAPGDYYFNQFEPHNQMTLYTLAGQVILNAPIRGVIISAAQILLEKPNRFVRGFTYRTQDQLDEWMLDLQLWLNSAEAYAAAGYWPQNDTACDKYGGCKFREVCSKSPQVREMFLKADFNKLPEDERWNPLQSR